MKNPLLNRSPKPHARLMHSLAAATQRETPNPFRAVNKKSKRAQVIAEARRQHKPIFLVSPTETPEETVRRISRAMGEKP